MKKGWILWILGMLVPLSARPIHTWSGVVDPGHLPQKTLETYRHSVYRLLQFPGPIQESWRRALEAQGIEIYRYFPEYTYLVRVPSDATLEAVKAALPVVEDLPYLPDFKIKPDIGTHTFQNPERKMDGRWWLSVEVFRDADLARVMDQLEQLGAEIETWTNLPEVKRVWIRVPKDRSVLRKIAAIPQVEYVEERLEYVKLNDRNRWVLQGNVQNPMDTTVWSHGIHGEDVVVAVMDSDLDERRCWFSGNDYAGRPKVIKNTPAPGNPSGTVDHCNACEHGTHVSGTVLGKTTGANAKYNGMAYEARLIFQDVQAGCGSQFLDIPSSLNQALTDALNNGARVHTNSWGSNSNTYSTYSQDFDAFLFANQEFLVTIAMGNSSSSGAFEDGTIGSPATGKNITAIGSTNKPPDQDTRAFYSSQGPTYDGRTKPDVMAPGGDASANQTNSADEGQNCGICQMSGTSMATPAAAGAAALVFEYFEKGYYPSGTATPADAFTPLGSLVKAMLVNSGEPMANEPAIPNSEIGWGRIKLRNVLYFPGDPYKLYVVNAKSGPTTGQTLTYTINVDSGFPLKVALAWYDAAGQNLVNDLDLEVVDPNGTVYKGNVFSNGWSTTGGGADNKNTVEAVRIQNPLRGTWTIYVKGTNVPTPASAPYSGQPFGLVATYKELIVNAPAIVTTPPDTVFMSASCGGGTQDSIKVSNSGTLTLNVNNVTTTQAPRLIIDGPTTFSLNTGQFQWVRFHIDTAGLAIGQYYLGDVIFHNNDPDPQDSAKKVMVKLAMTYPYNPANDYGPDNLEANNGGWTSNNNNGWKWGAPSGGGNPGTHSGSNVWGTVLNGNYLDGVNWTLDKTFYRNYYCGTPYLVIWHWYSIENGWDGGNVKYSLDGGNTWTLLYPRRGYDGTINSWSSGAPIQGEPAFTGQSGNWISDTFDLSFFTLNSTGQRNTGNQILAAPGDSIIIRFQFGTDANTNDLGWYIDDIQAVGLSPTPVVGMGGTVTGTEEQPVRTRLFQMVNPPVTRGNLHLRFQLPRGGKLRVALYDESGRQARKLFDGVVGPGVQEIQQHLDLPAGVYFLKVNAGSTTFKRRLVIVH